MELMEPSCAPRTYGYPSARTIRPSIPSQPPPSTASSTTLRAQSIQTGRPRSGGNVNRQLQVTGRLRAERINPSLFEQTFSLCGSVKLSSREGLKRTLSDFWRVRAIIPSLPTRRAKTGRAALERARLTRLDACFAPNAPPLFLRALISKPSNSTT